MRVLHLTCLCVLSALLFAAIVSAEPKELSLEECYRLALIQSETLKQQQERIKAAEERYVQALSEVFPEIRALANQRIRDNEDFGTYSNSNQDPEGFRSNVSRKHPFDTSFTVRQPIFNGFRDIFLSQARKADQRALELENKRIEELLYLDVAELFLQSRYYDEDLELLARAEKVLNDRVSELKGFIELGKSRESEIIAAYSDIADLLAGRERVKKLKNTSRESLAFLLGISAGEIKLSSEHKAVLLEPIDHYIKLLGERDDVRAAKERVLAFEKQVMAAERQRWPELNLDGNYYPYEDPDQNREWEVMFQLDVPLYEGGSLESQVREQEALLREQKLELQKIERTSERDVRIAYGEYLAAQEEVIKLKELADTTKRNYAAQREDYKNGVVTNLDVLQAIRQGVEAERRLLEVRTQVYLSAARLKVAAGAIS